LYKNFKKDCPDGELSRNKFYEMYIASFPGKNADEFIDHAFKTFDTDGSGYLY
jgi:Ca2+-binding EF-hand superfamily protein